MEQEHSELDQFFKKKLGDYKSPPLSSSWDHIEASLRAGEKQVRMKRRQQFLYVISAAAAMLVVTGLAAIFWLNQKQIITPNPIQASEKQPALVVQKKTEIVQKAIPESVKEMLTVSKKNIQPVTPQEVTLQTTDAKTEAWLPDSSKMYLNRNSKVRYAEDFLKNRVVHILEGEVFFDVKHQNNAPFVILTPLSKTQVMGTSFLIRTYPIKQADELFVSTGKVKFGLLTEQQSSAVFVAGEKGLLTSNGIQEHSPISDVNFDAWKSEKITFRDTPLPEVLSTLEKYYAVSLQVNSPAILSCRFTGRFEKSEIHEVLQVLAVSFHLSFDKQQGNYILSGKGCK